MGRVGSAYDNAMMESFFATLQRELLDRPPSGGWQTRKQLASAVFEWIEAWYNPHRRHSSIGHTEVKPGELIGPGGGWKIAVLVCAALCLETADRLGVDLPSFETMFSGESLEEEIERRVGDAANEAVSAGQLKDVPRHILEEVGGEGPGSAEEGARRLKAGTDGNADVKWNPTTKTFYQIGPGGAPQSIGTLEQWVD